MQAVMNESMWLFLNFLSGYEADFFSKSLSCLLADTRGSHAVFVSSLLRAQGFGAFDNLPPDITE